MIHPNVYVIANMLDLTFEDKICILEYITDEYVAQGRNLDYVELKYLIKEMKNELPNNTAR